MFYTLSFITLLITAISCYEPAPKLLQPNRTEPLEVKNNTLTIDNVMAIPLPTGYKRQVAINNSFGKWLQHIGIKNDRRVYHYDGTLKRNQAAQYAVLDISVGNKNLQQCADAVMRLRAEYLFAEKQYEQIIFIDNEQVKYKFTEPYTRPNFNKYLDRVFGRCGTASLSKQLLNSQSQAVTIGDVLIRGGFPGHAVIVVDVAENEEGQKIYLLAQSYMPAQDIHILINPTDDYLSPWYAVSNAPYVYTPEYTFTNREWKTW